MIKTTKATITFPLYKRVDNTFTQKNMRNKIAREVYHEPSEELVTILTGHIFEIQKTIREEENRKGHDNVTTYIRAEIVVKVITMNNSYMIFARRFNSQNLERMTKEAEKIVSKVRKAMDDYNLTANPFQSLQNLIMDKITKLTETIE